MIKSLLRTSVACLFLFLMIPASGYATTSDTTPPTAPGGLAVTNRTYTTISLSWSKASDDTGVRGYQVYRDGRKIIATSKTVYTNTDLVPGREYTFMIKAYDSAGNISEGSSPLVETTVADMQPPSAPGGLSVSADTFTTITLAWKPSTDNTGIKSYEIYCNESRKATTTATCYTCKGLAPGKIYTFYIIAYDIAGNPSPRTCTISACTTADHDAPSAPSGLKVGFATETELDFEWLPSSDNVKVSGYEVFKDGKKAVSVSGLTCKVKNLVPGESHAYYVKALDQSGNDSASSGLLNAAALKDLQAPTAPTGFKEVKMSGSSISLQWNASDDNVSVKGYNIYCNGNIIDTSTKTSRTVKNPSGLGINIYCVRAYDLVGNLSGESNTVTVID